MRDIYVEDLQTTELGKLAHLIYEEPQVIPDRFDSVTGRQNTMIKYRLQWLTKLLERYSPTMVRDFYTSYTTMIHRAFLKGKKPLPPTQIDGDQSEGPATGHLEDLYPLHIIWDRAPCLRSIDEFDYGVG